MTARVAFYFAAVIALVLFLAAAVPSHATQHREPTINPDYSAPVAKPAIPAVHSDSPATKVRSTPAANRKKSAQSHKSGSKSGR